MSFNSLKRANSEAKSDFDREHVTPYIRNSVSFTKSSIQYEEDQSEQRWTVDEPEDFKVITKIA